MKRFKNRISNRPQQKYFKAEEANETLKKDEIFDVNLKP